ncbi:AAA family ATPase [Candidatus Woesearchaeota archaeon]|nr:AAA family ATPase [Candidatus Woesearchaeota archaeon]
MSKLIIITGTPGTGKSTLAVKLARLLKFQRINLHDFYSEMSVGYDRKNKCYDVNINKFISLVKKLKKENKKGLILDSHIAHLLPKQLVDLCVVIICPNLKILEARLKKRKYSSHKIRDNLDAEIFQICLNEAKEKGHKVIILDGSKKIYVKNLAKDILKRLDIKKINDNIKTKF